jgi:hypothetical protein
MIPILTGLVLLAAVPTALLEIYRTGEVYVFSRRFLEELPQRLTGPGRFRFVMQPAVAIMLGVRGGLEDARAGRVPYLWGIFFHPERRQELLRSGLSQIANLIALAILLDAISQYLIYRQVHPVVACVVGPVLIVVPYSIARALSNRFARHRIR